MIPIADPQLGTGELERVRSVLESGDLVAGEAVSTFEDAVAADIGVDHAVATVNGTAALHAALAGLGIGEGDTVVTTPFSFVATANAVRLCGADVAFADVDPVTLNLDPAEVERVVAASDVDAILAAHLYGLPAEMDALRRIADEYDCHLVEDAAQAQGATYDGRPVGGIGDAGCFSFYPTENMTTGEGGMVVTDDPDLAERVERFVDHGRTGPHTHAELGHNYRMSNLAGAIGTVQVRKLPLYVAARRNNAAALSSALSGASVTVPPRFDDRTHAFHQYTLQLEGRDRVKQRIEERGVDARVYYPTPIHEQPAYDHVDGSFPVAEWAAERVLSLPVHPGLDGDEVEQVAEAARAAAAEEGTVARGRP